MGLGLNMGDHHVCGEDVPRTSSPPFFLQVTVWKTNTLKLNILLNDINVEAYLESVLTCSFKGKIPQEIGGWQGGTSCM